jgi:putative membrane protein insertion efficiency factor
LFFAKKGQERAYDKKPTSLNQILSWPFLMLIFVWQNALSPYISPACRFAPTCSEYSKQAFIRHGPIKGLLLTAWRLLRCHPLNKGGVDPVPD